MVEHRTAEPGVAGADAVGVSENPSFCAMGQKLGGDHQMVQRRVQRAVADGPLAALDDRPRPGKQPTITPEAMCWLMSLPCDMANDRGYAHGIVDDAAARYARQHDRQQGMRVLPV